MDIEKCGIAGSAVQGLVERRAAMTVGHDLHARRHQMRAQSPAVVVITIEHQNAHDPLRQHRPPRSEGHTSELQSLMRISYVLFCFTKNKNTTSSPRYSQ